MKFKPIEIKAIELAKKKLQDVVLETELQYNARYSDALKSSIWFKREDLQKVRSFKIRGAYNKISSLNNEDKLKGVVCSSAGNHAQGVALSCNKLQIDGVIYMPTITPNQKIEQVKMFGGKFIEVRLEGDTYDDAFSAAKKYCELENKCFIHPFDDLKVIEGQATLALETICQSKNKIDYIFVPIGGGGLISGIISVFKQLSPETKIIGIEPSGAPSMKTSLEKNTIVTLSKIDPFVDGAAVKKVGEISFSFCKQFLDDIILVPEGKICQTILDMYNKDAIVVEPAGAIAIAGLDYYKDEIKNKNVVCLVCGSNNDITRMSEIKEKALLFGNLKHYFVIKLPQRAGALKEFLTEILGPNDDITHFEYTKKNYREKGHAVVGLEIKNEKDLIPLIERMKANGFYDEYLNNKESLGQILV
ncbi:MAG: threonine dehydratase [Crocinitomicaceae bacterium]|nr:threonine dehydratase [Crocinitomicaceae bacterium]|tara:strand:+ start:1076 stop:2329 length:1254 start_codon:yes stop_codon:yes gene_type:complete